MIRTIAMLAFWTLAAPVAALIGFPWTFITGDIRLLYRLFMIGAWSGVRLTGVRVQTVGLDEIDPARTYIFMSNHVSNLDPPITIPLIPRRSSVMVKRELFKVPILGRAMRMGSLVPVDRGNRDAGIEAVRVAKQVVDQGLNMIIYIEGKRSFDGKLLPFKKGPFYLAEECQSSHRSYHHRWNALRHAESQVCHQTRISNRNLPHANRTRGFRQPRLPHGKGEESNREWLAGRMQNASSSISQKLLITKFNGNDRRISSVMYFQACSLRL